MALEMINGPALIGDIQRFQHYKQSIIIMQCSMTVRLREATVVAFWPRWSRERRYFVLTKN